MALIGAVLAMALLVGCDERTKQANDPSKPAMPKVEVKVKR